MDHGDLWFTPLQTRLRSFKVRVKENLREISMRLARRLPNGQSPPLSLLVDWVGGRREKMPQAHMKNKME